jgi:hypothetical protein
VDEQNAFFHPETINPKPYFRLVDTTTCSIVDKYVRSNEIFKHTSPLVKKNVDRNGSRWMRRGEERRRRRANEPLNLT